MKNDGGLNMNTNNDFTPLLRFPEYRRADSIWEKQKIGDIVKTIVPPKKLQSNEFKKTGKYPIVDQSQKYICSYSDDNLAVINGDANDLIIFGDHTCILKFIDFPFIQGADGIKIMVSSNPDKISTRYLFQFLKAFPIESNEYKRHFSELKEKTVFYPKLIEEQYKIADCFFSIDSCLSSINEKIEQLKAHKKSLMQKLFPQNDQTVPEYRFPIFQQNGEWRRKKMKEIITVNSGRDYKHLEAGEIPVYGTGGYMLSVNDKLSDIDAVGIGRKGTIDKPQYLKAPFWTVDTLFFLTSIEGYDIEFVYYLAQNIPWKKYGEQTGVPSLSKLSIENLEVLVPANKAEQKRISTMLSSLDYELFLLEKKMLLLETHKNGLVQQLFPPK